MTEQEKVTADLLALLRSKGVDPKDAAEIVAAAMETADALSEIASRPSPAVSPLPAPAAEVCERVPVGVIDTKAGQWIEGPLPPVMTPRAWALLLEILKDAAAKQESMS